ncbi:MAG TPA: SDR family NAD(P)-dependent oxidoreductase [Acidimicrobiales bacterium]
MGSSGRVAVVTGANQGLGFSLAAGLRERLEPDATVYLTGRNPDRVATAAASLASRGLTVAPEILDVADSGSVERFAAQLQERHGGVDIVVSNAAARISREEPMAAQVRSFVETNNHGTTRLLRALVPLLRPGGRYLVVASSFGTLRELPEQLHARFDDPALTLDDIDATMDAYVAAAEAGRESEEGWPNWINVPSKVGQVAAARIVAHEVGPEIFVAAVCPGLVDTDASRPWFDDMSGAQHRPPPETETVPPHIAAFLSQFRRGPLKLRRLPRS